MERLDFDLLFRWFVGLGTDDEVWDHSVFSKNQDRLLEAEIAAKFLAAILTRPEVKRLLSPQAAIPRGRSNARAIKASFISASVHHAGVPGMPSRTPPRGAGALAR